MDDKEMLFKNMYLIDEVSAKLSVKNKDNSLRKQHHLNMTWLKDHGLTEEYYEYWIKFTNEKDMFGEIRIS